MNAVWFYAHDDNKIGPFSDQKLRDLADAGEIVPTDTVWKEGIADGVVAGKVKNLFPPKQEIPTQPDTPSGLADGSNTAPNAASLIAGNDVASIPSASECIPVDPEVHSEPIPPPPAAPPAYRRQVNEIKERKVRAVAGTGVVILGQDGAKVRFKKKCVKCGFEDSCYHSMTITIGANRSTFFCKKCCQSHQVEFRGVPG